MKSQLPFKRFSPLTNQNLKRIFRRDEDGCLVELIFQFSKEFLHVCANENNDTIDFKVHRSHDLKGFCEETSSKNWESLIGKKFCWGWVAVNQQGFFDMVALSFGTIFPKIVLNVTGSSINIGEITFRKGT